MAIGTGCDFVFPQEFILFDTEFTSWEGAMERNWSGPNEYREVIQIGAIRVEAAGLQETGDFSVYAKPVKNPALSEYIMQLTGILQNDIDTKGKSFADALTDFLGFVGALPAYSWGGDEKVLAENCGFIGDARTFSPEQFINLAPHVEPCFARAGIDITQYTSGTLIQAFDVPQERRAHDALNDMRNLLDAVRKVA